MADKRPPTYPTPFGRDQMRKLERSVDRQWRRYNQATYCRLRDSQERRAGVEAKR